MGAGDALDHRAQAVVARGQHQFDAGEIGEAHRRARGRGEGPGVGGGEEVQFLGHQLAMGKVAHRAEVVEHPEVDGEVLQPRLDEAAHRVDDAQPHLREFQPHRFGEGHREDMGDGTRQAEGDLAERFGAGLPHRRPGVVKGGEDAAGMGEQHLAGLGQGDAAG